MKISGADVWRPTVTLVIFAVFGAVVGLLVPTSPMVTDRFETKYLIVLNAIGLVLLLIVTLAYSDLRRVKPSIEARVSERYSRILQRLDGIFHARTGLSTHLLSYENTADFVGTYAEEATQFLQFLTNEACTIFEDYTAQMCAVSIKLLVPSEMTGEPLVQTYLRDQRSFAVRAELYGQDGRYPFAQHSPFVSIVSADAPQDYFICNNLRKARQEGTYRNGNKHWHRLYNATLIVPIKDPSMLSRENILGFFCIDSIDGKFDNKGALHLARIIANTVFYVIYSLSAIEKRKTDTDTLPSMRTADER